jgi:outer membrane receptor protein involved in Fe transport
MRRSLAWAATCLVLGLSVAAASNASMRKYELDIPRQSLDLALKDLAQQTGLQIALFSDSVDSTAIVGPVRGSLTPAQALDVLLGKQGLGYKVVNDRMIAIVKPGAKPAETPDEAGRPGTVTLPAEFQTLRLAQNAQQPEMHSDSISGAVAGSPAGPSEKLEEVLVTAQKREERLQDVPVPVTALGGTALADANNFRIQDYYAQVPGFALASDDLGAMVAIRGIAPAGFGNPTVGFMIDDVPYGASTSYGGGFIAPEIDPGDLARIEVLRGPQGTLYGASSMGGLVKYVTVDPTLDAVSGRIQAGLSAVRYGTQAGYDVSGAVNLPLNDTFALLASGFRRRDPGYIENIRAGERGLDETDVSGGRLAALWRPSPLFSLKLSALVQKTEQFGSPYTTTVTGFGDLQQSFLPHSSVLDKKFAAFSAIATAKLSAVDLVAITGYGDSRITSKYDVTASNGPQTAAAYPTENTLDFLTAHTRKFTEEVRLSSSIGDHFDWLIGGFYTHESTPTLEDWIATDNDTQPLGVFAEFTVATTYSEGAGFADLTYHVTDRFDVQLGGRYSQIHETYASEDNGPYVRLYEGQDPPLVNPDLAGRDHASTYLVTPRFKITPDIMLYARFASGYRAGGVNPPLITSSGKVPPQYAPDTTVNSEVGIKGAALGRALSFDASVYSIDWKNIQVGLIDPQSSISYYTNGSRAKSQGVELSVQVVPQRGLRLGGWVAFNKAVLTRDMPPDSASFGLSGYRLPFSSRVSGNASADYEVPVGEFTVSGGATVSYVGDRYGDFTDTAQRQVLPAYTTTDLRTSAKRRAWTLDLYLNNVTDRRGIIGGGYGTVNPTYFNFIRPRTIGLSVARTF